MGTARTRASNKYNAKVYDRVNLVLKKDSQQNKEAVQAAADAAGESLNSYIVNAIAQRMEWEKDSGNEQADDAYCAKLLRDYEDDPDKGNFVPFEDACKELGVTL